MSSRPVPVLGSYGRNRAGHGNSFPGRNLVVAAAGSGGMDAVAEQPSGDRFDAGTGGAGQAHVPLLDTMPTSTSTSTANTPRPVGPRRRSGCPRPMAPLRFGIPQRDTVKRCGSLEPWSRCRWHSAVGQGTRCGSQKARAAADAIPVRVDGAAPWPRLEGLEGGARSSSSSLAERRPRRGCGRVCHKRQTGLVFAFRGIAFHGFSPPQVCRVSNAFPMHIQCMRSACAVQV